MSTHPFVPLRHRAVRLLWGSALVSDTGTWVQLLVVGTMVAGDTGSAVQTGLVALATFMPQGIASPIGGILADRYDRRKVFATALMVQALVTTGLAVALGFGVRNPFVLTAFILFASAAGATGAPAYSAMQPDLVPPEELTAMVSLGVYSWNGGRIVGPMLGAALAVAVGPAWTVGFNAATFVVLAVAVSLLRRPFRPHGAPAGTVRSRLADGWRTMRSTPGCADGVKVLVLLNMFIIPFMGLIPIYATATFGGGAALAGTFATAQGIGAIIGGVVITMLSPRIRPSSMVAGVVVAVTAGLALYAAAPTAPVAVAAIVILGSCVAGAFVSITPVVQRHAPDASRGRVMSIMQASMGVSYGIGLLAIGTIGDLASMRIGFGIGAVMMVVAFSAFVRIVAGWRASFDGDVVVAERDGLGSARLSPAAGQ